MRTRVVVWLAVAAAAAGGWAQAQAAERPAADSIRAAIAAARPAVVAIEVTRAPGAAQFPNIIIPQAPELPRGQQPRQWRWEWRWPPRPGQPGDPPPRVLPFGPPQMLQGPQPTRGAGVVVRVEGDRGLIAAPERLVAGAQEIMVRLADGRKLAAKLLGTDTLTGTACLEVRGPKLALAKPLAPAKPEAVRVGDWVAAVGDATTVGIVSAKHRPGPGDLAGARLLLTDALLPPDMAGCAVVSLKGELVGMALPAAPAMGRGPQLTAVLPAHTLVATATELAAKGKVARGWLGIMFAPVPREELERLGIAHGVRVGQVLDDTPAAHAGIQDGDVLVEFAGKPIADTAAFRGIVAATKPGTRVPVKLLRGGQPQTVHVTVGEKKDEGGGVAAMPRGGETVDIGLTLQPLTPELAEQLGLKGQKGIVVTAVAADSPAAKARPAPIEPGDLIREIARKPVATVADAKAALEAARAAKAKSVLLLVKSRQGTRYIVVDLPR